MISAVVSARFAGLDRIKSGFTSRFDNRLPIFGASRLPRSFNGRSLSGNAVSSQLDFACRMRNSVFMPHSLRLSLAAPRAGTKQKIDAPVRYAEDPSIECHHTSPFRFSAQARRSGLAR